MIAGATNNELRKETENENNLFAGVTPSLIAYAWYILLTALFTSNLLFPSRKTWWSIGTCF